MNARSAAQILLLSAVWGVSFLLIRVAGEGFPPLWIALMRCSLGAALLWAVLALTGRSAPPRQRLPWLLVVAAFNNAIPFTCFAWGEKVVPSNTASVLNATTPIWTLLLTMAVQRTRARWNVMAGVAVGFAGVLLVVLRQSSGNGSNTSRGSFFFGVLLILTGALGYAIATVIAKARLQGVDPLGVAATQLLFGGLLVLPLAAATGRPSHLHAAQWLAVLTLGLAGSGLAYLLYFHLLTTHSATHVTAVTYLLPVWGVFWGAVARERIGWATGVGVAITIAGLVMMNLRRPSPQPAAGMSHLPTR